MDWIERLNKAMEYLEEHMMEEISYEKAARIACCSTYHFQRMVCLYGKRATFRIYPPQEDVSGC